MKTDSATLARIRADQWRRRDEPHVVPLVAAYRRAVEFAAMP